MKPRTQHNERTKLIVINGRLNIVPMRRKRGAWIMSAPRLATAEEIQQAALDADFPADFFEALHGDERLWNEEILFRRHCNAKDRKVTQ